MGGLNGRTPSKFDGLNMVMYYSTEVIFFFSPRDCVRVCVGVAVCPEDREKLGLLWVTAEVCLQYVYV